LRQDSLDEHRGGRRSGCVIESVHLVSDGPSIRGFRLKATRELILEPLHLLRRGRTLHRVNRQPLRQSASVLTRESRSEPRRRLPTIAEGEQPPTFCREPFSKGERDGRHVA
jgi:hypothetical protein